MIGVALVAFITVFAASAKTSVSTSIDKAMKSQWIVDTQYGMGGLSPSVTRSIEALPETGSVTGLRVVETTVDGHVQSMSAFDPANVEDNIKLDVKSGDYTKLALHQVAVQAEVAEITT